MYRVGRQVISKVWQVVFVEILRVGGLLLQLLCSRQARKKMQPELLRKNKLRAPAVAHA